jgi:hypothetical protein
MHWLHPSLPLLFNRLGFLLAGVLNPHPKMPATERQVWQHYRRAFLRLSKQRRSKVRHPLRQLAPFLGVHTVVM